MLKAWEVNSPVQTRQIILIGLSGNYALSQITCASNFTNSKLQDDNKHACDHLVDPSIKIIKYLKGPHGRWINPHILPWIPSI